MSRVLILTRHAKSSWDDPLLDDHDRPLNKRGRKSAPAIGAWLRAQGWLPDEVLSSSATRTRETWDRMGLQAISKRFTRALYLAEPEDMLAELTTASGGTVLMLGHNPGISEFASRIVAQAPRHPRFHDYPTGATTVIRFALTDWTQISWHSGTVLDFAVPRELLE
ncbi:MULTISPECIES: histidine phosphatase family protein [unclassified Ruegeria]|uniref:SixA phosphatase family protein n=1 Tax=unclassified Ruegeria TaxID=2625375 RepID=UPI0014891EFC|nr:MULTISPECIES: histidine phosphatase family protein [unclassified Ruegeria]